MRRSLAIATQPYGTYNNGRVSSSSLPVKYEANEHDYVDEFHSLLSKWRSETLWCSFISDALENDSFKKIIDVGNKHREEILELIINEVDKQPDLLMAALPILTNQDPTSEEDRGNLSAMAISWVQWFQHR